MHTQIVLTLWVPLNSDDYYFTFDFRRLLTNTFLHVTHAG